MAKSRRFFIESAWKGWPTRVLKRLLRILGPFDSVAEDDGLPIGADREAQNLIVLDLVLPVDFFDLPVNQFASIVHVRRRRLSARILCPLTGVPCASGDVPPDAFSTGIRNRRDDEITADGRGHRIRSRLGKLGLLDRRLICAVVGPCSSEIDIDIVRRGVSRRVLGRHPLATVREHNEFRVVGDAKRRRFRGEVHRTGKRLSDKRVAQALSESPFEVSLGVSALAMNTQRSVVIENVVLSGCVRLTVVPSESWCGCRSQNDGIRHRIDHRHHASVFMPQDVTMQNP